MTEEAPPQAVLKAALPIFHLGELWEGHGWRVRNPAQQLFLPIAPDGTGRFRFYRLVVGESQLLNFVREEADAVILDQPTVIEWQQRVALSDSAPSSFAAILGDPVEHSRTPQHHRDFFTQYGMPVLKIRVTPDDLQTCDVLQILMGLGLRAAAVTSPLKRWLRESIAAHGGQWQVLTEADPQEAGNTLVIDQGGTLIGAFTDGIGLRQAWQQTLLEHDPLLGPEPRLAVYGGGGLLPLLQQVFDKALFLSARTGELREPAVSPFATPIAEEISVLVWSVPRSRFARNPPSWLRPRLVFDLNYAPDSPGRDYANQVGATYVDGSRFFVEQAAAQQTFWQSHLPTHKGNRS
jgi:shikimate dehydrogenase